MLDDADLRQPYDEQDLVERQVARYGRLERQYGALLARWGVGRILSGEQRRNLEQELLLARTQTGRLIRDVGQACHRGEIWQAVGQSGDAFRHAEMVVQSRLNNFLVADSILFLSWATLFVGQDRAGRTAVLLMLSGLSAVLSLLWTLLGSRERRFLQLHHHLVADLEDRLPNRYRNYWFVRTLRTRRSIELDPGGRIELGLSGAYVSSGVLLVIAPIAFAVASGILIWASLP
jgi:hypothetical protein